MGIMGSPPPPMRLSLPPRPPPLLFSPPIAIPAILLSSSLSVSQARFTLVDPLCSVRPHCFHSSVPGIPEEEEEEGSESLVQDLKVPDAWLVPSKAREESEWLRITLHKWLDDEYCPEPTNIEISKLAAQAYYESLISNETDLGEILLNIVRQLENISFQQSFHGPFSSANAAVRLISLRIDPTVE